MTSRDFCYWLQGFLELRAETDAPITAPQASAIKRHLDMVFAHEIDPSFGRAEQAKLSEIHNPTPAEVPDQTEERAKKVAEGTAFVRPRDYFGPPRLMC